MSKKQLKRIKNALLLGGLSAILVILFTSFGFLKESTDALESTALDKRYELRGGLLGKVGAHSKKAGQIVVVKIDEKSLKDLGRYYDWTRRYHATLIDSLVKCGAHSIGFDIIFTDRSKNPAEDSILVESTRESGIIFHCLHLSEDLSRPLSDLFEMRFAYDFPPEVVDHFVSNQNLETPIKELYKASKGLGNVTLVPDQDGVNRYFPLFINYRGKAYPSLGFELARNYLGVSREDVQIELGKHIKLGDVKIPIDKNGRMLINYLGKPEETISSHSFSDFVTGAINSRNISLENQIVLVGASAAGLYDLRVTPVSKTLPGVYIHANIIQNIIQGPFLRKFGFVSLLFIIFILSISTAIITNQIKVFPATISVFVLIFLYFAFSIYLFEAHNRWLEVVRPIFGIVLAYISTMTFRYITEEKQKKFIKSTFQHYLNPSVVDQVVDNPEMLKLGGEKRSMTVLFSDVQGFTTISEMMEPEDLVVLLNNYLSAMTKIVFQYSGTLDKYEGDAIMAFWNAPSPQKDHSILGCHAALDMQKKLEIMRSEWEKEGKIPLYMRIGINSGEMVVGNMGSEERFDYTVMGDSVNLGARLEPANKHYGTYLMISQYTYEMAKEAIEARELDALRVKGKQEPVVVYELLAKKGELSEKQEKVLKYYNEGLRLYKPDQRKWKEAMEFFQKALEIERKDGPSVEYYRRCKHFLQNPPPEDWDGVYVLTSK